MSLVQNELRTLCRRGCSFTLASQKEFLGLALDQDSRAEKLQSYYPTGSFDFDKAEQASRILAYLTAHP